MTPRARQRGEARRRPPARRARSRARPAAAPPSASPRTCLAGGPAAACSVVAGPAPLAGIVADHARRRPLEGQPRPRAGRGRSGESAQRARGRPSAAGSRFDARRVRGERCAAASTGATARARPDTPRRWSSSGRSRATRRRRPGRSRARRGRRTARRRRRRSTRRRCCARRRSSTWLSAVNDLLCMRRFRRAKSVSVAERRASARRANGLNRRTSMFGCASSAASAASSPAVLMSSSSRRTRTPRSAARRSASSSSVPDQVVVPDVVLHVERALGGVGEQHTRGEGIAAIGQREHARAARVCGGKRRDGAAQFRLCRRFRAARLGSALVHVQMAATR